MTLPYTTISVISATTKLTLVAAQYTRPGFEIFTKIIMEVLLATICKPLKIGYGTVGCIVGVILGSMDGSSVGHNEGSVDGVNEGYDDGSTDGYKDGVNVG